MRQKKHELFIDYMKNLNDLQSKKPLTAVRIWQGVIAVIGLLIVAWVAALIREAWTLVMIVPVWVFVLVIGEQD